MDIACNIINSMDTVNMTTVNVLKTEVQPELEKDTCKLCSFCGKQFPKTSTLNKHKSFCKMNRAGPQIICAYCGKTFAHRSSLHRHEIICREGTTANKFKCPVCFSEFARIDNYKKHYRQCNPEVTKDTTTATCKHCHKLFSNTEELETHTCISKKKPLLSTCLYGDCKMRFYRRSQLTRHLRKVHGNRIEEEKNMVFGNLNDFLEWKFCEEQATYSCFTKRSGTRVNTDYYYCHLDGSSKPHCKTGEPARKTSRRIKNGVTKTDRICLAKIKVKIESDGSCKVVYQPTHSHKLNTKDHRPHILLIDTVKYINEQLSNGISPKKCFQGIINGTVNNADSQVSETKASPPILVSGINTLALYKRIKIRNNRDDAISVMTRVALLSKERPNPVILYKPLGEDKVIGPSKTDKLINSLDLFILGIQTKEQKSMLLQRGGVILSVGWVDDTNAYDYRLLTFVVPDEHNRGYPVAFFILNQFNVSVLSVCLLAIKESCTDLVISNVITPDNPYVLEALQRSFDKDVVYILCLSNIYKIFKQFLEDMVPDELVYSMYQSLCSVIECEDESNVRPLLDQFINNYSETAPTFINFLTENYMCRLNQWTVACRNFEFGNVDTTVFNESLHNKIKAVCSNNVTTKRLDNLINVLLGVEEDDYKNKYIEEITGIPYGLSDVAIRHEEGLKIPDNCITQLQSNLWIVISETDSKNVYEIVKSRYDCTNDICYFTCNSFECNCLCSHMYSCSCEDRNPLCSHIHKLQIFLHCNSVQNAVTAESSDEDFETSRISNKKKSSTSSPHEKLDKIRVHLEQLSGYIQSEQIQQVVLDRIESCLQQLVIEVQDTYEPSAIEQKPNIKNGVYSEDHNSEADLTRYEFEYVHQIDDTCVNLNELGDSTPSLDQLIADIAPESFTPSIFYADLDQVIIKIGTQELSLLNLKSLDPYMSNEDLECIRQCSTFRDRYMCPSLINSFLFHLQLSHNHIALISSDIALTLERNDKAKVFMTKELVEKNVLIMPMNLSSKYWTCIAVFTKQNEITYFNPFGKMPRKDEKTILNFLTNIAENVEWNITMPNYNVDIEDDKMAYGVHMCHFAEKVAEQADLIPLRDIDAFRKHIYDSIVGGCLKRNLYSDVLCGKCNSYDCPYVQDEITDVSICCTKCNQWYHTLCIGVVEIDVYNTDFICPT